MNGVRAALTGFLIVTFFGMLVLAVWLNLRGTSAGYDVYELHDRRESFERAEDELEAEINRSRAPAPLERRLDAFAGEAEQAPRPRPEWPRPAPGETAVPEMTGFEAR